MKEFLALFIVGFSMSSLSAQISTIPDIPDPNDSLVLTVNLTRVTAQGQNDDPDAHSDLWMPLRLEKTCISGHGIQLCTHWDTPT